jgi:hypothetical protein
MLPYASDLSSTERGMMARAVPTGSALTGNERLYPAKLLLGITGFVGVCYLLLATQGSL